MTLFGAPNKGKTISYQLRSPLTEISPTKIEEFNDFLRFSSDSPVLFEADLIFKDFSKMPHIFMYFSRMCEPCRWDHGS